MRLIIAGSRELTPTFDDIDDALFWLEWDPEVVLCGMCRGPDMVGHAWAKSHNRNIWEYPADWVRLGRRAGMVRNTQMAQDADTMLAFVLPSGSPGTNQMIRVAKQYGVEVEVILQSPAPSATRAASPSLPGG
jgi:hypothetical protein